MYPLQESLHIFDAVLVVNLAVSAYFLVFPVYAVFGYVNRYSQPELFLNIFTASYTHFG